MSTMFICTSLLLGNPSAVSPSKFLESMDFLKCVPNFPSVILWFCPFSLIIPSPLYLHSPRFTLSESNPKLFKMLRGWSGRNKRWPWYVLRSKQKKQRKNDKSIDLANIKWLGRSLVETFSCSCWRWWKLYTYQLPKKPQKIQINAVHFLVMLRLDPGKDTEQVPRLCQMLLWLIEIVKGLLHKFAGLAYELVLT